MFFLFLFKYNGTGAAERLHHPTTDDSDSQDFFQNSMQTSTLEPYHDTIRQIHTEYYLFYKQTFVDFLQNYKNDF